jgi:broad-specificity NMP kinase
MKRAHRRGWREESLLTLEKCELFWNKIRALKNKRKKAIIVNTSHRTPASVLKSVQKAVT